MLHAMATAVQAQSGADLALGFDGDGDRCGVVDNEGDEIFADKIGVMLARDLLGTIRDATFVVDVKSTGLFATDPVLARQRRQDRLLEDRPFAHQAPGARPAGAWPASRNRATSSSTRRSDAATTTASSPRSRCSTCSIAIPGSRWPISIALCRRPGARRPCRPHCADEVKYDVADRVVARFKAMRAKGELLGGQPIRDIVTVNGVRVTVEDGTWGLVRASSNKPELVVVVESPVSEARMREMFEAVDGVLRENPEVGAYNQTI